MNKSTAVDFNVVKVKEMAVVKANQNPEAPDTHHSLQRPVATGTIDMGRNLGTVPHPSPALGSTSALHAHEGQADLDDKRKKQVKFLTTTCCFSN